jgi:hypothetical protein
LSQSPAVDLRGLVDAASPGTVVELSQGNQNFVDGLKPAKRRTKARQRCKAFIHPLTASENEDDRRRPEMKGCNYPGRILAGEGEADQ